MYTQKVEEDQFLYQREILLRYKPRPCKLGNYLHCVYQHFDSVGRSSKMRSGECKIVQLFECHFLSVKELVRGIYFFNWNLLSSSAVIPILWAMDPGGTMKLLKRFGKSLCTPSIVYKQNSVVHVRTDAHTDIPTEIL